MGRGWELLTGAFLATLRPVAGTLEAGGIIYTAIFVPRDKFLSCKCDVPSRSENGAERRRRRGKDLIATRFTTSETVMSAIEQLGGVIKIEKKIKSADEIVFNCHIKITLIKRRDYVWISRYEICCESKVKKL